MWPAGILLSVTVTSFAVLVLLHPRPQLPTQRQALSTFSAEVPCHWVLYPKVWVLPLRHQRPLFHSVIVDLVTSTATAAPFCNTICLLRHRSTHMVCTAASFLSASVALASARPSQKARNTGCRAHTQSSQCWSGSAPSSKVRKHLTHVYHMRAT